MLVVILKHNLFQIHHPAYIRLLLITESTRRMLLLCFFLMVFCPMNSIYIEKKKKYETHDLNIVAAIKYD